MSQKPKELDVEYDFVFIIDCLPENERTSFELSKDLMDFLAKNGIQQTTSICSNKKLVIATLNYLNQIAKSGKKFCIHFISHGDKDGLWIKETKEDIYWNEFTTHLNEINNNLSQTLTINMTSCLGLNGIKIINEGDTDLPFFGLIGYSEELEIGRGKRINELFYTKLLDNKKIDEAVEEIKAELSDQNLYCISSMGYKALKNTLNKYN